MLRILIALTAATASIAATPSPPPQGLAAYIRSGVFDPGDYGWMRGAFDDATAAQRADWRALTTWQTQCGRTIRAAIVADFARRGVTVTTEGNDASTGLCGDVGFAILPYHSGDHWIDFQAAVARARPIAQAIIWSAALAQSVADPDVPDEASELAARITTDQVLRSALIWNNGPVRGAPPLDDAAQGIVTAMIGRAIFERDNANTVWLRALVARKGWPTIAAVGERSSIDAWLLVQHADSDPVFQYDMLQLMAPLASRGAIARRNFAMLDDRVRLKLSGKQRYGTQFTCRGGSHVPLPLEDEDQVAARRGAMDMDTLAQNAARMDKNYGPCPPDVIPRSSTPR